MTIELGLIHYYIRLLRWLPKFHHPEVEQEKLEAPEMELFPPTTTTTTSAGTGRTGWTGRSPRPPRSPTHQNHFVSAAGSHDAGSRYRIASPRPKRSSTPTTQSEDIPPNLQRSSRRETRGSLVKSQ